MKTRFPPRLPAAAFACCLAFVATMPLPSPGATTVANLTNADPVTVDLGFTPLAMSFTTAADRAVLSSVTVALANASSSGDTFSAAIYSDAAGRPGTALESFPDQFSRQLEFMLTFNSAGLSLDPHTTYWLVLGDSPSVAYWRGTGLLTESSAYGWTIGDSIQWHTTGGWGVLSGGQPDLGRFSVDATILPEPATLTLAVLPAGLSVLGRRRRPTTPA